MLTPGDGNTVDGADFDYEILDDADHRPWPMPASPWVMTQSWQDLLFAHWPVDKKRLALQIPRGLELDLHHGEAWIGIVPFRMAHVAPRGVPALPWVSAFPELNVRTFVRVGNKPGVFFFSLDAGNPIAVAAARTLFNLPYHSASMEVVADAGTIRFRSHRAGPGPVDADFAATYGPAGGASYAAPHSLEHFLMERYCLYTVDAAGQPQRLEVHHRRWALQPATAVFQTNTMAEANGIVLSGVTPRLHFASRQDVVAWLPTRAE